MNRANASRHAQRTYYCTCGKIVRGNGGRAQHRAMHVRRGEWLGNRHYDRGFTFVSKAEFRPCVDDNCMLRGQVHGGGHRIAIQVPFAVANLLGFVKR